MSYEIVWTAAAKTHLAKGEGRSGYGTGYGLVRLTRGMPANLTRFLENLLAYRVLPEVPGEEGKPRATPVDLFHVTGSYGGRPIYVLGRRAQTAAASGRSNNIVHLVAHQAHDFQGVPMEYSAGPAAELAHLPWETGWAYDREPGFREDAESLRPSLAAEAHVKPCAQWQRAVGDAGWAGVLADAGERRRPVLLIVPRGGDFSAKVLSLFEEALQLLPPSRRWQVTFCTYLMGNLPAGVQCLWRVAYAESPEAVQKRSPETLLIDLRVKQPVRAADESPRVALARDGGVAPWHDELELDPEAAALEEAVAGGVETEEDTYALGARPVRRAAPVPRVRQAAPPPPEPPVWWNPWMLLPAGVVALLGVGLGIIFWPRPATPVVGRGAGQSKVEDDDRRNDRPADPSMEVVSLTPVGPDDDSPAEGPGPAETEPAPIEPARIEPPRPEPASFDPVPPPRETRPRGRRWLDAVREAGGRLPLQGNVKAGGIASDAVGELMSLDLDGGEVAPPLELELLGANLWFGPSVDVRLERSVDGATHTWRITKAARGGLAGPQEIGRFVWEKGALRFERPAGAMSAELDFCWLALDVGGDREVVALREVQELDARTAEMLVPFAGGQKEQERTIELAKWLPKEALGKVSQAMTVVIEPGPELKPYWRSPPAALTSAKPVTVEFGVEAGAPAVEVDLKALLTTRDGRGVTLLAERFGYMRGIDRLSLQITPEVRTNDFIKDFEGRLQLKREALNGDRARNEAAKGEVNKNKKLSDEEKKARVAALNESNARIDAALAAIAENEQRAAAFQTASRRIFERGACRVRLMWDTGDALPASLSPARREALSTLARTSEKDRPSGKETP